MSTFLTQLAHHLSTSMPAIKGEEATLQNGSSLSTPLAQERYQITMPTGMKGKPPCIYTHSRGKRERTGGHPWRVWSPPTYALKTYTATSLNTAVCTGDQHVTFTRWLVWLLTDFTFDQTWLHRRNGILSLATKSTRYCLLAVDIEHTVCKITNDPWPMQYAVKTHIHTIAVDRDICKDVKIQSLQLYITLQQIWCLVRSLLTLP